MSDEELCKRLVDWSEHDEGKINDARQEAKLRIEALEQQVADLLADVPCACGYDNPTDVCMKHLPLVRDMTAKLAKAVEERDTLRLVIEANIEKHRSRAEAAEAKLAKAAEALRDLTKAFAEKVDVDQTRWKTPYEHPLSAYDRAVAFLKGDKP
jgi:hypothetical protein